MWECSNCSQPIHDYEEGYLVADDDLTNWRIVHRFTCDPHTGPWHPLVQFIGKRGTKNFEYMRRGGAFNDLPKNAIEKLRQLVVREDVQSRRPARPIFREWLRAQERRDDPIGDLARDMAGDYGQQLYNPSLNDLYRYISVKGAFDGARAALIAAYREWQSLGNTYRQTQTPRHKPQPARRKPAQKSTQGRDGWLALRFRILKRDGYRCQLCGQNAQDGVKLEVDHKHPRSKGGTDDPTNLWTLCFDCNRGKRDNLL